MKRFLILVLAACGGGTNDMGSTDAGPPCTAGAAPFCNGDQLITCVDGVDTVSDDCAAMQETCGFHGATVECVDACAEAGVSTAPSCAPDGVIACVPDGSGIDRVVLTPCDTGQSCQGGACVAESCGDVGPGGRCTGDVLTTCANGTPTDTDCAASGQVCAYGPSGYACTAAAHGKVVTGFVHYEDRPPQTNGSLGAIEVLPARGAQVAVVRDSDTQTLGLAITADDGSFQIAYDADDGTPMHVVAVAKDPLAARPGTVETPAGQVHGFGGPSFAAAATADVDVLVTDASHESEAFNVLDQMTRQFDAIREMIGDPTPRDLTAFWDVGNLDGTYYDGSVHLVGGSDDDDGYDDTVILHECGHYIEDTEGRSDSPGGNHDGSPTDPRLAWSEGWATYWEMAVRDLPTYMDSNASGGWGYNADTSVTAANASGTLSQNVSEDMVTEDLWDLADSGTSDDDTVASGHMAVVDVQPQYLRTATLRNVGATGVDLVDFLDGWFLSQGLTPCAGAKNIVTTVRHFPYDYAGPAGTCP